VPITTGARGVPPWVRLLRDLLARARAPPVKRLRGGRQAVADHGDQHPAAGAWSSSYPRSVTQGRRRGATGNASRQRRTVGVDHCPDWPGWCTRLESLLLMAFLYTVPLIPVPARHPLPSDRTELRRALNNLGGVRHFISVFAVASEVVRVLFLLFVFPFDYLTVLLAGLVALPVFIAGLNASYQDSSPTPSNAALFTRAKCGRHAARYNGACGVGMPRRDRARF